MEDKLHKLFKDFENQFDTEEPNSGHLNRFKLKLNNNKNSFFGSNFKLYSLLAAAASVILFFGIFVGKNLNNNTLELAQISPEMRETQQFFVAAIEQQLYKIELERNLETNEIINDAFIQLKRLETEYTDLTKELKLNYEDQRIIYAMISNFQQRIIVLQQLVTQIEQINQLKKQKNEEII
jgi:hypothetical protein